MNDDGIRMIKQKGGGEKNEHVYDEDKSNCLDLFFFWDMNCERLILG